MQKQIKQIQDQALTDIAAANDPDDLDGIRVSVLGKKGSLTQILRGMKDLSAEERPLVGKLVNLAKAAIEKALDEGKTRLVQQTRADAAKTERVDISLPGRRPLRGSLHPLTQTLEEIVHIFERMGFIWEDGPEVEKPWYNFDALNFPPDHPARDEHDTLFINNDLLLRTHTSPVQIRVMQRHQPPVRILAPGWVFRSDSIDATHSPMFSQVEGLLVDKHVSFADLKGMLDHFAKEFFGPKTRTRFRASFFPFTEPSAEVDVSCWGCGGSGEQKNGTCSVCKGTGWVELLGAGMVDPAVYEAVGYDPEEVTGWAFGIGIERVAMARYDIDNIRLLFEGDLRFLRQFP
ncbi:MAG: phenylalanine--tRNA ligase subunit alpha [Candidatus Lernaella stagnicola]|nr:phenylalanine--tRNA ligase subunit alpha [Candidatus Lernaella stagnicola]